MKLAVIGSRTIQDLDLSLYIPGDVTEIISGGATGIDTLAEQFADKKRLSKHILRPQYHRFPSRVAPIKRNEEIVAHCDSILVFWDGASKGTYSTIQYAKKLANPLRFTNFKTMYLFLYEKQLTHNCTIVSFQKRFVLCFIH